jgi:hypothetical protein
MISVASKISLYYVFLTSDLRPLIPDPCYRLGALFDDPGVT